MIRPRPTQQEPGSATRYSALFPDATHPRRAGPCRGCRPARPPVGSLPAFGYPITFDTSGNLYELATGNGILYEINKTNGQVIHQVQTSAFDAMGFASDNAGNLWAVKDGHLYEIDKVAGATLKNISLVGEPGFGATMGLQIDSNNDFYATSYAPDSTLYSLNSANGVLTAIGSTGLYYGHGGVFVGGNDSVVPEPSTLISACLGGLACLGYAWRRRKSKQAA